MKVARLARGLEAQRQWGVWGALPTSSVAYDRAD